MLCDPQILPSALIGKRVPQFSLMSIDGREVTAASLRGRPVVVNFWASWCLECKQEHPVLLRAYRRFGADVAFVGVLYQDRVQDAEAFLAQLGDAGYPNLIDPDDRLALDFGVSGVPETFFVDAAGIVRFKQWGALSDAVMEQQLRLLTASSADRP